MFIYLPFVDVGSGHFYLDMGLQSFSAIHEVIYSAHVTVCTAVPTMLLHRLFVIEVWVLVCLYTPAEGVRTSVDSWTPALPIQLGCRWLHGTIVMHQIVKIFDNITAIQSLECLSEFALFLAHLTLSGFFGVGYRMR